MHGCSSPAALNVIEAKKVFLGNISEVRRIFDLKQKRFSKEISPKFGDFLILSKKGFLRINLRSSENFWFEAKKGFLMDYL